MKRIIFVFFVFSLTGCAAPPERREPLLDLPKEAVMFQFGYSTAFEKIFQALEANGYDVAIADRRAGIIQTHPKEMKISPEGSPVQYRGVFMIRLDGDSRRSWAVIRFALLPELPGEREKLIRQIEKDVPPSR